MKRNKPVRASRLLFLLVAALLAGCAEPRAQVKSESFNLASIEQRAKAAPYNGDLQFSLAQEYMRYGRYGEAAEAYKSSHLNNTILETWSWHYSANAYEKAGKQEAAIAALKRSIELNPSYADNYVFLARLYYGRSQYDDAIAAAKQAIAIQSTLWVAHHYVGVSYGKKRQYPEALDSLRRASELAPKEAANFTWMGDFYLEQDLFPEAVSSYLKTSELAPGDTRGPGGVAIAYFFMGRWDDAMSYASRATELSSFTGLGLNMSGGGTFPMVAGVVENGPAAKAGLKMGDVITAIDGQSARNWGFDISKFVQAARGPVGTQVVLTVEREGASFQKSIARETLDSPGKANFLEIRSMCYLNRGDLTRALEDANAAVAINPKDASGYYALTSIHLRNGDFDKALQSAQSVSGSLGPLLKATALAKLSRTDKAAETFATINRADFSPRRVPIAADLKAFFEAMKTYVSETRSRAAALESKGQHPEALAAYSDAIKVADDAECRSILSTCFALVRKNPSLGQVPEEARKYAIRSEVQVKDGNFKEGLAEIRKAVAEAPYIGQFYYNSALIQAEMKQYREAIASMNIFLASSPDSPHARAARDEIIKWELRIEKGK